MRILVFAAALIGTALLPGCTFNVYLTDQVVYGTVTHERPGPNEQFPSLTAKSREVTP